MKLSPEDEKKYYLKVAHGLIRDGVTGWTEESLAEHLINDPGNPFRPLSKEELDRRLQEADSLITKGECVDADEVFRKFKPKIDSDS